MDIEPGPSPVPVVIVEAGNSFPWWEFWLVTVPTVLLAVVTLHADHELFVTLRMVLTRVLPPYRKPSTNDEVTD